MGSVQTGGETFSLSLDFPKYEDEDGNSIPTNFYVAASIPDWSAFVLFDDQGGIFTLDKIAPCTPRSIDPIYSKVLEFNYCNPGAAVKVDMYVLAIESGYDPNNNLNFEPTDAPFEFWHFDFEFSQCE